MATVTLAADGYEKNNEAKEAKPFEKIKGSASLTIANTSSSGGDGATTVTADEDWYKVTLDNTGMAKNLLKATYSKTTGILDMALYAASGTGDSMTAITDEEVGFTSMTLNTEQISMAGLPAGTYFLKVSGEENAEGKYTLNWDTTNYGPKIDKFDAAGTGDRDIDKDVNGDSGSSKSLNDIKAKGSLSGLSIHSPDDEDWYQLDLTNVGMAKNLVKTTYSGATGRLDMELYKVSGSSVTPMEEGVDVVSSRTEKSEQISLTGLEAGSYLVRVFGIDDAQGKYTLNWDAANYGPKIDVYDAKATDGDTDLEKDANNTAATATDLNAVKVKGSASSLSIHSQTDVDVYKLTLDNVGMAKNLIKATFSNATGNLEMKVYSDKTLKTEVQSTVTETEKTKQVSLEGLEAGEYYVKVSGGDDEAQGKYNLTWDATNYGSPIDVNDTRGDGDTELEKDANATAAEGTNLNTIKDKGSLSKLSIHSAEDVDYYQLTLDNVGMAKNLVKAVFSKATGNLDMQLFEASDTWKAGEEITDAHRFILTEKSAQISLEGLEAGNYVLKVSGLDEAQGLYNLNWDVTNYGPKVDTYDPDGYGGNDEVEEATLLPKEKGSLSKLSISSVEDVDYYELTLGNTGFSKNVIKATYSNTNGRLDMELFDAKDKAVSSAVSTLTEKSEQISLDGLPAGTYYVKVRGLGEEDATAQGVYNLTWDATNYGPKPDTYETNDSQDKATPITKDKGTFKTLSIHSTDDKDFFKFELADSGGSSNIVKALFDTSKGGELEMELYNSSGSEVTGENVVTKTEDGVQVSLANQPAGEYWINVLGVDGGQNTYTLSWDITGQ